MDLSLIRARKVKVEINKYKHLKNGWVGVSSGFQDRLFNSPRAVVSYDRPALTLPRSNSLPRKLPVSGWWTPKSTRRDCVLLISTWHAIQHVREDVERRLGKSPTGARAVTKKKKREASLSGREGDRPEMQRGKGRVVLFRFSDCKWKKKLSLMELSSKPPFIFPFSCSAHFHLIIFVNIIFFSPLLLGQSSWLPLFALMNHFRCISAACFLRLSPTVSLICWVTNDLQILRSNFLHGWPLLILTLEFKAKNWRSNFCEGFYV